MTISSEEYRALTQRLKSEADERLLRIIRMMEFFLEAAEKRPGAKMNIGLLWLTVKAWLAQEGFTVAQLEAAGEMLDKFRSTARYLNSLPA